MSIRQHILPGLTAALALVAAPPSLAQMDRLEWSYRPIVVIADSTNDPTLSDIGIVLRQSRDALADRDVMVVTVAGNEVTVWDPALNEAPELSFDADRLREAYARAGEPVSITLVGKDGGIKERGSRPGDIQDMLDLIDTMPMRQREVRAREREAERRQEIENRLWGGETFGR